MRKYFIPRDEITSNKGTIIMRKIKRIMAPARILEIEENLVNLFIEIWESDAEDETT